jgi:transposase
MSHPQAAGIDVGAEAPGVCVPTDRDAQPVQPGSAFPCDLPRLADWGTTCRMTSVAMAATGGDWMPLVHILEARGFAVALVKARHGNHVPGRPKTERFAGRWLQTWQTEGLWAPSCRPPADVCQLRRLLRHRDPLRRMTGTHLPPRQPSRAPMPLHWPHVLREVTGVPGRRLLRAMVAGERDPQPCATSRDSRMPSSEAPRATALEGDDRPAPGGTLTHARALDDWTPPHSAACAQDIARGLRPGDSLVDPDEHPFPPPTTAHRPPQRHEPAFALRPPLSRMPGVALTPVPG